MADGSLIVRGEEERKSIQALFDKTAEGALNIGDEVQIERGKHAGKQGVIFWQGKDRYHREYGNDFVRSLRDVKKRYGWRAGIETHNGKRVFVDANYICTNP